jgi:hypothetical protein
MCKQIFKILIPINCKLSDQCATQIVFLFQIKLSATNLNVELQWNIDRCRDLSPPSSNSYAGTLHPSSIFNLRLERAQTHTGLNTGTHFLNNLYAFIVTWLQLDLIFLNMICNTICKLVFFVYIVLLAIELYATYAPPYPLATTSCHAICMRTSMHHFGCNTISVDSVTGSKFLTI